VLVGRPAPLKVSGVFLVTDQLSAFMTYRHEAEHLPACNKRFPHTGGARLEHATCRDGVSSAPFNVGKSHNSAETLA